MYNAEVLTTAGRGTTPENVGTGTSVRVGAKAIFCERTVLRGNWRTVLFRTVCTYFMTATTQLAATRRIFISVLKLTTYVKQSNVAVWSHQPLFEEVRVPTPS